MEEAQKRKLKEEKGRGAGLDTVREAIRNEAAKWKERFIALGESLGEENVQAHVQWAG